MKLLKTITSTLLLVVIVSGSFYLGRISQVLYPATETPQDPTRPTQPLAVAPPSSPSIPSPAAAQSAVQVQRVLECIPDPVPADTGWKKSVVFSTPKETLRKVVSQEDGPTQTSRHSLRFFDFGGVTAGPHEGARLVVSHLSYAHTLKVCEADGCGPSGTQFQRFLLKGKKLTFLPALSEAPEDEKFFNQAITELGLELGRDELFSIPLFKTPLPHLALEGGCISFASQSVGHGVERNASPSRKIGVHALYGEFKEVGQLLQAALPDGTILSYYFMPPKELEIPG